jgi:hypothetical protein
MMGNEWCWQGAQDETGSESNYQLDASSLQMCALMNVGMSHQMSARANVYTHNREDGVEHKYIAHIAGIENVANVSFAIDRCCFD